MGEVQETLHHLSMAFRKEYLVHEKYAGYRNPLCHNE